MNDNNVNYQEMLQRMEAAAREGAEKGAKEALERGFTGEGPKGRRVGGAASGAASGLGGFFGGLLGKLLVPVVIVLLVMVVVPKLNPFSRLSGQIGVENGANSHDLVLENNGLLGYTAADFAEAILKDANQLKKIEVYQMNVSDMATLTDTGFLNLKFLTKTQCITYNGIATYTVDLGKLKSDSISYDKDTKTVTMKIPHAELEPVNVPSDQIEFGEVKKGALAFGKISMTPEELAQVQTAAVDMMEEKLAKENKAADADRFAKMSVWEIYQPVISSMSRECQLVVEFAE